MIFSPVLTCEEEEDAEEEEEEEEEATIWISVSSATYFGILKYKKSIK